MDEIKALKSTISSPQYDPMFQNIFESLNMLVHTSRVSVGLIDQALESKGLFQTMAVVDFVNNISKLPANFAQSEGIAAIYVRCEIYFNSHKVTAAELDKLFVKCDVTNIQIFIDNILSNAVRFTDPELGVDIVIRLTEVEETIQFCISVTDFCPQGLRSDVFRYLRTQLGILYYIKLCRNMHNTV